MMMNKTNSKLEKTEHADSAVIQVDQKSDKTESKLRKSFRKAIAWIVGDDIVEESEHISEEDREEIRLLAQEAKRTLRIAYDNSLKAVYTDQESGFNRIGAANIIELKYEEYVDFHYYVESTFSKDLEFMIAYKRYIESLNIGNDPTKTFRDNVGLRRAMSDLRGDKVQKNVLMAIFDGETELASWILDSDKLMRADKSLRKKIILNLISRPIITSYMFMSWLNELPKKFINTEERAELLMDYALRNSDKPNTSCKNAEDFILHEEKKVHPYR